MKEVVAVAVPTWRDTLRRWRRALEPPFTTLGVEFLCSWAWPMSYIVYASNTSLFTAWFVGWLMYFGICMTLTWINTHLVNVASPSPSISGAYVVNDLMFENDDRPRFIEKQSNHMLFARLGAQWAGALIGNGYIESNFPGAKIAMTRLYTDIAGTRSFYMLLVVQIVMGSIQGGFTLRNAQTDPKKQLTQGIFWDAMRSGVWSSCLVYPWGGPSFSIISYMWVFYAYQQPSLMVLAVHVISILCQGLGAKLVSELSFRETAVIISPKKNK
jgi:hypothetical protein